MVVDASCPGNTSVSSGRESTSLCRLLTMSAVLPAREVCSSYRAVENCISTEKYIFLFYIITAASFRMSRCMDYLNCKSSHLENFQIIQQYIRYDRTSFCHSVLSCSQKVHEASLPPDDRHRLGILYFSFTACRRHNMIKMSMCQQDRCGLSTHLYHFLIDFLREISRIYHNHFTCSLYSSENNSLYIQDPGCISAVLNSS